MKSQTPNLPALIAALCLLTFATSSAQSLMGTWQLVKETTCLEDEMDMETESDSTQDLVADMKTMSSPSAQIIRFKDKGQIEESTRILSKKKTANNRNYLYKFNGESLLILDRKSQTIVETFTVDKFSADSLILSNSKRACDTKVFVKIKESKKN